MKRLPVGLAMFERDDDESENSSDVGMDRPIRFHNSNSSLGQARRPVRRPVRDSFKDDAPLPQEGTVSPSRRVRVHGGLRSIALPRGKGVVIPSLLTGGPGPAPGSGSGSRHQAAPSGQAPQSAAVILLNASLARIRGSRSTFQHPKCTLCPPPPDAIDG